MSKTQKSSLRYLKKPINLFFVYALPAGFSLFALTPEFITGARCDTVFVEVATAFNREMIAYIPFSVYGIYYSGFILIATILLMHDIVNQKNKTRKIMSILMVSGTFLMTLPTFLFLVIIPGSGNMFPSVLCRFAIFVTLTLFAAAYLEHKEIK